MNKLHLTLAVLALVLAGWPSISRADPALCTRAAAKAARQTGVPLRVLMAITLAETGRKTGDSIAPWPWALNQGGDSHWLDSQEEALADLDQALSAGITNIDVGCFQLNWRWHAENFTSLDQMMDPEANALYAAELLARLFREKGTWSAAAGAYHSATPDHATRYIARFDKIFTALGDTPGKEIQLALADLPPETEADLRPNDFPLLQAGSQGAIGSIVPLGQAPRPLFGG